MSSTSLNKIYKTKSICFEELTNGHGSAPPVWDYISIKCTGKKLPIFCDDLKWFWKLWKDGRLSENEKAVLLSTYDFAYIEINRLDDFSRASFEMHQKILKSEWDWSHWEDISVNAVKLFKKHDYRCLGMGIGCTSVCDPWGSFEVGKPWGIYEELSKLNV